MTGTGLLDTALWLGLFVLLGGCYGVLYGAGRLAGRLGILRAGFLCYGLQCLLALLVVAWSPLNGFWKAFIVASTVAYLIIPPITWRFLLRAH